MEYSRLSYAITDMYQWDPYQMSNLHPNAPTEDGQQTPFEAGHKTILGRPTIQLIHRLDAVVLVQKTCKQNSCRIPWTQLHRNGSVKNLLNALDEKYDSYYARLHEVGKVGWENYYQGNEATLYLKSNERPLWADVEGEVVGNQTSSLKRWEYEDWFDYEDWT